MYRTSIQTSFSLCPVCVFSLWLSAPFLSTLFPPVSLPLHVASVQHAQEPNLQSHRNLIQNLGNMFSLMIALVYSGKQKMVVIQSVLALNIQQTVLLLVIKISGSPNEREEKPRLKPEPYKDGSVREAFYCSYSLHECRGLDKKIPLWVAHPTGPHLPRLLKTCREDNKLWGMPTPQKHLGRTSVTWPAALHAGQDQP